MIAVKNLTKHFDNGLVKAINGVSFAIDEGEAVAIVGPSGCGKTTLLNLVGGLDLPTAGEVRIEGRNLGCCQALDLFRRKTVGFIFQFHHLLPHLTLLENVQIPIRSHSLSRKANRDRAAQLLRDMGLEERMDFLPTKVSGGERQRAAIARAMVNDPRIILADEPTGSVDTLTGGRIIDLLIDLCHTRKLTMLVATHNMEVAAKAHRIIRMRNGLVETAM